MCSEIRCCCYIVGKRIVSAWIWTFKLFLSVCLFLPAIIVERCCSLYFLKDYEQRLRLYISITLMIILILLGVHFSLYYHTGDLYHLINKDNGYLAKSTLSLHISLLTINVIASVGNVLIEKYNYWKLHESTNLRKGRKEYSLAERFQIAENIRVCNVICPFLLL